MKVTPTKIKHMKTLPEIRVFHSRQCNLSLSVQMKGKDSTVVEATGDAVTLQALSLLLEEIVQELGLEESKGRFIQLPEEQDIDQNTACFRWCDRAKVGASRPELMLKPYFDPANPETQPEDAVAILPIGNWKVTELAGLTLSLLEGVEA